MGNNRGPTPAKVAGKRVPKSKVRSVKGEIQGITVEPEGLELARVDGLTPKMQMFVDYYVITLNGTRSAQLAGYGGDDSSLAATASYLLRNLKIKGEIDSRLREYTMSANEILTRITDIARGDIGDCLNSMGGIDITEAQRRGKSHLIKRIKTKVTTITDERNNRDTEIVETEIELYDAQAALTVLAKYNGLLVERVKVETWEDRAIRDISAGNLDFDTLVDMFDRPMAIKLFMAAGIAVE